MTLALVPDAPDRFAGDMQASGFALRVEDPEFVRRTRVMPFVHEPTGMPLDVVLAGSGLEDEFLDRAVPTDIGGDRVHELLGMRQFLRRQTSMIVELRGNPRGMGVAVTMLECHARESRSMSDTARLVTAEELEKFPDDDYRYELVEGRIIRMSPVGFRHGRTVIALAALLRRHAQEGRTGAVVTEVGFKLASNPDTVRAPDVAFVRQDRIPIPDPRGFWNGPPDLAVEVLSPDDRPGDVREKVDEYLTRGVRLVLIVDADDRTITVFRPGTPPVRLGADDILDLNGVVPGFRCSVRDIFE